MERCWRPVLLLWLTAVVSINRQGSNGAAVDEAKLGKKAENQLAQVIPNADNTSSVTKLVVQGGHITLNKADRLALVSYPSLVELHLDGNQVAGIPAKYFTVVPQLKVLSLSKNIISSLDPESFSGLPFLTQLDLSNNLLTSLPTELFSGLKNLQVLKLQGNPWNCSCQLLRTIEEVKDSTGTGGGPTVICKSPEQLDGKDLSEASAVCHPSPAPTISTDLDKPPTPVSVRKSWALSTVFKTTSQGNNISKGPTTVSGNTWKFTACIAALGLCTSILILCAIKGPSWYKLIHNYRHRRLNSMEEEDDDVSTVFSGTERYLNQQTFTFERENQRSEEMEEEEDGYFEDPYIKREE